MSEEAKDDRDLDVVQCANCGARITDEGGRGFEVAEQEINYRSIQVCDNDGKKYLEYGAIVDSFGVEDDPRIHCRSCGHVFPVPEGFWQLF